MFGDRRGISTAVAVLALVAIIVLAIVFLIAIAYIVPLLLVMGGIALVALVPNLWGRLVGVIAVVGGIVLLVLVYSQSTLTLALQHLQP